MERRVGSGEKVKGEREEGNDEKGKEAIPKRLSSGMNIVSKS